MNISISAYTAEYGKFRFAERKGIFAEAQIFPLALGIRVNTQMTVTVVKHYLLSFHTALTGACEVSIA